MSGNMGWTNMGKVRNMSKFSGGNLAGNDPLGFSDNHGRRR
jgi:hypothetical protein